MRLGGRDRDAGNALRRSLRFLLCIQFGFDFRVRELDQSTHEVGEHIRIAHDLLGRIGWAI